MKVLASVKRICRNCKIYSTPRHCACDLYRSASQAASGLIVDSCLGKF